VILDLIRKVEGRLRSGLGRAREREGESWFKLLTASVFYRLIYRITDVKIRLTTGDFRLIDRKIVDVMNQNA